MLTDKEMRLRALVARDAARTGPVKLGTVLQRMLKLLSDGRSHGYSELRLCLNDSDSSDNTVRVELHRLRKLLMPLQLGVELRKLNGSTAYALVALDR